MRTTISKLLPLHFVFLCLLNSCLVDLQDRSTNRRETFKPYIEDTNTTDDVPVEETEETIVETRPSGEILIREDYCVCLNGKNDTLKNCESFCSDKTDSKATIYLSFDLSANVLQKFGTVSNWCTQEINDGVTTPTCQLKVEGNDGASYADVPVFYGDNNKVKFDVSNQLKYDETYKISLIEIKSGASSDIVQVRRKNPDIDTTSYALLPFTPISQYSCLDIKGFQQSSDNYYNYASRVHFYFPSNNEPTPMPPGSDYRVCHDRRIYGENDSSGIPRFELTPFEWRFHLWSSSDPRFFDTDQTNVLDINEFISDELLNRYGQSTSGTPSYFQEFKWFTSPVEESSSRLGFLLQPFVNQFSENGLLKTKVYCPKYEDYQDETRPIFKILGELISVETEALYIAQREPEYISDENGDPILDENGVPQLASPDYLFIREGLLKKIWFYYENGQLKTPNEELATQRTIYFHWPPSDNPTQAQAHQKVYKIKSFSELSSQNQNDSGIRTNFPPPDKRIGCIPNVIGN